MPRQPLKALIFIALAGCGAAQTETIGSVDTVFKFIDMLSLPNLR